MELTRTRRKRLPYPTPIEQEAGCKVGWMFYADATLAERCAAAAAHNRQIAHEDGYDFGQQWPGTIDFDKSRGLYRVCIP